MQTGKMGKTGGAARKDKQGRQAMMLELSLATIHTVKMIYEYYQMRANHSEIIMYEEDCGFHRQMTRRCPLHFVKSQNSDPSI